MGYALVLVRSASLNLEAFARATGTHPDLVRRLVALGVLDADRDAAGELWFAPSQAARSWAGSSGSAPDSGSTTRPSGWSPTCWTGSRYSKQPCGSARRPGR